MVEGPEHCEESVSESVVDYPVELCSLQPQQHCRTTKAAVPKLTPERRCRQVEKEICSTSLVNPHPTEQNVIIKYCARPEVLGSGYGAPPPTSYGSR